MPRRKALPKPAAPVATMTAYVDAQGRTLLAVAALPGREPRVFATVRRPPSRRPGDPPPAPPAEKRAEEWAREFGAGELVWTDPRPVVAPGGQPPLDAAMLALQLDAWQREQSERKQRRSKRSA